MSFDSDSERLRRLGNELGEMSVLAKALAELNERLESAVPGETDMDAIGVEVDRLRLRWTPDEGKDGGGRHGPPPSAKNSKGVVVGRRFHNLSKTEPIRGLNRRS